MTLSNAGSIAKSDCDTPMTQIATRSGVLWFQGLAEMQAEWIRFLADRARKDLRVPIDLAACATPIEAIDVATSFAVDAANDYLCEAQRLFGRLAGDFESVSAEVI